MNKDTKQILVFSLAALAVMKMKSSKQKRKRLWEREWLSKRNEGRGVLHMLHQELRLQDEYSFRNYLRMNEECFVKLLNLIKHQIQKNDTCMRSCIPADKRLSVALRYLATGETQTSLSYSTRIAHNTISIIIGEVLNAIINSLQDTFLKAPATEEEWLCIAKEFEDLWNFPNCLGALDGKHISFRPLRSTGSFYRNYKGHDSIVLLALVSATYAFLVVDIGVNGRISDGGVFNRSSLSTAMKNNVLNFPPVKPLPGRNMNIPYVIVADDAFPLKEYIMKPYRWKGLSYEQTIYNYRLSRARRTVENAFGILSNRFRIFLQPINLKVEKVELITKAACILHIFLLQSSPNYKPMEDEQLNCPLQTLIQQGGNRTGVQAQDIRKEFEEYFNTNGQVPWQNDSI